MEQQDIIIKLEAKGIKPTANRILVLKTLASEHHPQSLSSLEHKMLTMDKSSIFRVLTLFLEHDVVHAFEDGRGILNYELCEEEGRHPHPKLRITRRILSTLHLLRHQRRMPGM